MLQILFLKKLYLTVPKLGMTCSWLMSHIVLYNVWNLLDSKFFWFGICPKYFKMPVWSIFVTGFDLTGPDSWSTTRFWISMTELFAIVNLFTTIYEIKENTNGFFIFEIWIRWSLSNMNKQMINIYKHFQYWLTLISFLYLMLILSVFFLNRVTINLISNLKKASAKLH